MGATIKFNSHRNVSVGSRPSESNFEIPPIVFIEIKAIE